MEKTNLLILMDDEHSSKVLGCYGHPLVKTPNLDRLAATGTLFENAYTNSPICVPARATIATGRHVHETRCWDNAIAYDGHMRSWTHRLQQTGHRVESIGKLHYRNADNLAGFDRQIVPMHITNGRGDTHGLVRDPPPVRKQGKKFAEEIGPGDSVYIQYDKKITEEACHWIKQEGPHEQQPWVLFVSFIAPHFPLIAPPEYYALYNPDNMPMPKQRRDSLSQTHPWWQAFEHSFVFDRSFKSDQERRIAIASYFGLCSFVDAQFGRILDTLSTTGLDANTRILYFSDHGENLGTRRLWGKSTMYEESAGIPMILSGPDVPRGKRCTTPVSQVDIYPTVLNAVGATPDAEDQSLPGTSLFSIAAQPNQTERTVLSQYHASGAISGAYMLRCGRYKLIYYAGYVPELYDLETDPEELDNLAGLPAHAKTLKELEQLLRTQLDPDAVDRMAKVDQHKMIEQYGGREAVLEFGGIHGTPAPVQSN